MLIVDLVAALAVGGGVQREDRITCLQQRLAHRTTVDEVVVLVPVLLRPGPTVQQQHQRPGLLPRFGKFDVPGHEKTLGAAEHNFLPLPTILVPLAHQSALQRDGSVVIEKGQPRFERFLADSRVRRRLLRKYSENLRREGAAEKQNQ